MKLIKTIVASATVALLASMGRGEIFTVKVSGIVNESNNWLIFGPYVSIGDAMVAYYYIDTDITSSQYPGETIRYGSGIPGSFMEAGSITLRMNTSIGMDVDDNRDDHTGFLYDSIAVWSTGGTGTYWEGITGLSGGTNQSVLITNMFDDLVGSLDLYPRDIFGAVMANAEFNRMRMGGNQSNLYHYVGGPINRIQIMPGIVSPATEAIPEPGTYGAIAGAACLGVALTRRRRKIAA